MSQDSPKCILGQCADKQEVLASSQEAVVVMQMQPLRQTKEQESLQSCGFCRPHRFTSLTVELDCYSKIQSVKQCHCVSVSVSKSGNSERTMLRHLLLI
ncbi:Gremlin-2 [Anabarilius grahami]|uniref:Gremlin-2 n=1 Tax=Anabarilius grahami TaxID=495550 RepID=A0A3N0Y0N2_ANAGA|nr:Gremlin-2 [Anabarilius grahami]